MKRLLISLLGLLILSFASITTAQVMPDYVIRAAQEINAIYGENTIDINADIAWDWRGGSIGDDFNLTAGCTSPITLPASTTATGYYRVFFDTNFDGTDDWVVIVYSDYSYFGMCSAQPYQCGMPPRLTIGKRAHVDPDGIPNNLRAQPGESGQLIGEIPPSGEFSVLDGPRCASGMNFWLVNYNGSQGWTVEGQNADYYLLPGELVSAVTELNATPINPTPATDPTAIPVFICGSVTSRLYVGLMAQVTPGLPNNLRALPGESGTLLGEIPPGFPFTIVGGPECNSNLLWWQVNYQGTIGWTAEAGSPEDYWIAPIGTGDPSIITASTVLQLTTAITLTPQVSALPLATYINKNNYVIGVWSNHKAIWELGDVSVLVPDPSKLTSVERELTNQPLGTRLDSSEQAVAIVRSTINVNHIQLEGGLFVDEFDLSRNNTSLDVAAFHPTDGDMIVLSQRGQGFIFVDSNPESPTYRSVSQAGRVLLPSEIYMQLEFSANGQRFMGLTDASNLMIWQGTDADPATWQPMYPILLADDVEIYDAALSPDGSKLLVVGIRNLPNSAQRLGFYTLYTLAELGAEEVKTVYMSDEKPVTSAEFTPDGSLIALSTGGNAITIVDTTLAPIRTITTSEPVYDFAFNIKQSLMASTSQTGTITIWKIGG